MGAEVFDSVRERLAGIAAGGELSHGVLAFDVDTARLGEVTGLLKTEFGFDLFLDLTAVDWPEREPRFDLVYHFYSTTDRVRVRLKLRVPESEPTVGTLCGLYGSARYMERECHEMFGIKFRGNGDLRPILLYEGFKGHPLRKDYPKQLEQPLVPSRK